MAAGREMDELAQVDALVQAGLSLWPLPTGALARRINVAENVTYLIEATGYRAVLRVHRVGYHTRRAIECELAWSQALSAEGSVPTPRVISGRNSAAVQVLGAHFAVLFEFVPGEHPDEDDDLVVSFEGLGMIAARAHEHAMRWDRPEPFERLSWDAEAVFGAEATWGDWRNAPNVTRDVKDVLEKVEARVTERLLAFGRGPERFGLIHADMRLANLLIEGETTRVIDFDDCGFGWFLYDFASAISFMEDHPQVPALRAAWVAGYRSVRALPESDEREISSFVMLRRMALLAWIGSRAGAPEPEKYAPDFARVSAELGAAYLSEMG